jgi:hypothetical protein
VAPATLPVPQNMKIEHSGKDADVAHRHGSQSKAFRAVSRGRTTLAGSVDHPGVVDGIELPTLG